MNQDQFLKMGGKRMFITMVIVAPPGATVRQVKDFLSELECAGGCRHPDEDVMFDSLLVESSTVKVVR